MDLEVSITERPSDATVAGAGIQSSTQTQEHMRRCRFLYSRLELHYFSTLVQVRRLNVISSCFISIQTACHYMCIYLLPPPPCACLPACSPPPPSLMHMHASPCRESSAAPIWGEGKADAASAAAWMRLLSGHSTACPTQAVPCLSGSAGHTTTCPSQAALRLSGFAGRGPNGQG